jgi:hypothetical protein
MERYGPSFDWLLIAALVMLVIVLLPLAMIESHRRLQRWGRGKKR